MITELERKQLKELLQAHYADDVLKILSQNMVLNRNGEPHNAQYVRMVFQGFRKNSDIEAAIWQLATEKKKELDLQKARKQNILKNKP
ncbi:hypothetical protein RQM59_08360 [Flavobacteriaceae bacterium S356]|uniref:Uncharacterized protein n=1 Tax=Asprobacillus argus TaxID=3076534 RepID=A0ABU3LF96_9FLAO|nr:hypothetical protein [Flavobacteriaceae bacterium S356]